MTTDISGNALANVHATYRRWFGAEYDLGALDAVLCAAAAEQLAGDPPWLLLIGGSGAAKTETIVPLAEAGAKVISTISGEAALLSGTSTKERAKDATGGLLKEIGPNGTLVIKDVTSILSMNRDTRALVLAALREVYDGRWSRTIGSDGGKTLSWHGRLIVVGAVTTAWDAAHSVVSAMGDRFVLVRIAADTKGRKAAGLQAMLNVSNETTMREELGAAVRKLLDTMSLETGNIRLTEAETSVIFDLADLVTRGRTAVERDYQGRPLFAHALEMPTRLAKQLVQIARGGLALGMTRDDAMAVAVRCAGDTMPPLRLRILGDIATAPDSSTTDAIRRLQLPRTTVDRVLQELHLLGLLTMNSIDRTWYYSLASEASAEVIGQLTRNVTTGIRQPGNPVASLYKSNAAP